MKVDKVFEVMLTIGNVPRIATVIAYDVAGAKAFLVQHFKVLYGNYPPSIVFEKFVQLGKAKRGVVNV